MKLRRILTVLFALCLMLGVLALSASAETVASGTCGAKGDNLTWVLDDEGTLTVSGKGNMQTFLWTGEDRGWYEYRAKIKTVILEEGVTSIGKYAFDKCEALTRVELAESVTKAEPCAFRYCSSLQSIEIPAGFKGLGENMFYDCKNLQTVILPEGLERIGRGTFHGCSSLKTVNIPSTVNEIRTTAFMQSGLTSITIPENVRLIDMYAFYGCVQLKVIAFRGDAPRIDGTAFDGNMDYAHVTATAYYPADNATWTADKLKPYRGEITWEPAQTLKITAQPKTAYVQRGKTAKVTVKAAGDGLTYTWYVKDKGQTKYTKSSASGSTYSTTMSNTRKDRMLYCVVRDVWGEEIKTKTVYLRMAATVSAQPKSAAVKAGETAEVSVKAVGDGLTYAWYIAAPGSDSFTKSTSCTGTTYSVQMTESRSGRQVYCVVKDKYGKTAKTNTVVLDMYVPVKITAQPKAAYVQRGKTAKVTVKAEGFGLTYQWYVKNAGTSSYKTSSVTGPTYSTKMTDAARDRMIYCVVTDMFGEKVKTKTVSLRMAASITAQPKHMGGKAGEKVKTTVKAMGDGLTYTWYVKNAGEKKFTKSSVKTASYSVTLSEKTDGRQVYCVVKDKYGKTAKSDTVRFGLPVKITTQPKTAYVKWQKTADVTVEADGDGLTYTWYVKQKGEKKYTKTSQTAAAYSVKMDGDSRDSMVYCVVKDQYGYSVKSKTVSLRTAATVTGSPYDEWEGAGTIVTLRVWAQGDGLTYTWYYKDRNDKSFTKIKSATDREYEFKMTEEASGRQFYCVVKDKYGNTAKSKAAKVTVIYGPI